MAKKRIMVFCDFYLPGYKSGGGMWTVVNLVDRFCDRFDFYVVTRNYDGKQDKTPYTNVRTGEWNSVGSGKVFYLSRRMLTEKTLEKLAGEVKPDIFFLNSVFSTPAIKFLRARMRRSIAEKPVILAPCGELAKAALELKPLKKIVYLRYAKFAGLFRGVIWKASSQLEVPEIRDVAGSNAEVLIAPDLPPRAILPDFSLDSKPAKLPGAVKFIFISRLVRKKNIHFLLENLNEITEGEVNLEIIGAHEDAAYWAKCERIIAGLPANITVDAPGAMQYFDLLERLTASHFFVLPTLTENFGYVFLEAMASGCPLLISDRTIWSDIESAGVGWTLPLENPDEWVNKLKKILAMDKVEFDNMSRAARKYAVDWLANKKVEEATEKVLDRAERELGK